ncbi:MAG TPA: amidase family protein [Arenicellales bacterium]|jgi:amidase|nr:amidase family protein [Pseudomonadales bacterium]MDP7316410.1 amidase family protein [Pseudomonadales bacterium]HJL54096.1 amidase family protein [Arenicellales bacterium]HJP50051.1 amidase family protein [Pseudomonadales bacterium]|tara:strand:- start:8564 stop:9949 length:1386 start_codon:yes stop_codon:yes gene_type:complete
MDSLCERTATELAELIREGQVSSKEVVEAHLNRMEEVNPYVNAVTLTLGESALEQAALADNASQNDRQRLFHGVPFTVKENIDLLGTPTTQGLPAMAEAMPGQNAPIVDRMIAAGAIPIGRTNLPEMGARLDTDNPLRGRTLNPWNRDLTPGGSSGGEAAALATGMTPFGLGNDIGGSLRNPAYCCGIAALKPSIGRVPCVFSMEPVDMGVAGTFLTDGPMARSVNDLRVGLSVLAGRHIDDPQSVDVPLEGIIPKSPKAALVTEMAGYQIPPAIKSEIERAGEVLANRGWSVDVVDAPELDRVYEIWGKILMHGSNLEDMGDVVKPETMASLKRMQAVFNLQSLTLDEAMTERRRLRRLWSAFLTEYTVAIGPTWATLPWPIDTDLDPDKGIGVLKDSWPFIVPGNALGIPSVALPTGVSDGLPTGIQVYSELYREDLCLWAAEIIESESQCPTPIEPVR